MFQISIEHSPTRAAETIYKASRAAAETKFRQMCRIHAFAHITLSNLAEGVILMERPGLKDNLI